MTFFVLFWIKTKFNKTWNCGYSSPEMGFKWQNALYILNSDASKILGSCFSCNKKSKEEKNFKSVQRYWTSIENMKKQKPCIRRENRYSYNNSDIKSFFPIIYNNCPKHILNGLEKIQKTFREKPYLRNMKFFIITIHWRVKKCWYFKRNYNSSILLDEKTLW